MTPKYFTEMPDTGASEPLDREGEVLAPEDFTPLMRSDAHQIAAPINNIQQAAARGFGQCGAYIPASLCSCSSWTQCCSVVQPSALGASFPVSLAAACVLGFITYRAQMRWYGDDSENARIKAVILAFLTAIPTPLPAFLYVPAGAVGLVHSLRRKS